MQFSKYIYFHTFFLITKNEFTFVFSSENTSKCLNINTYSLGDVRTKIPKWHPWCFVCCQRRASPPSLSQHNNYNTKNTYLFSWAFKLNLTSQIYIAMPKLIYSVHTHCFPSIQSVFILMPNFQLWNTLFTASPPLLKLLPLHMYWI